MENWYLIVIAAMGSVLIIGFFYLLNLQGKLDFMRAKAETDQRLINIAKDTANNTHNVLTHKINQYKDLCEDFCTRHWHIDDVTNIFQKELQKLPYTGIYAVTRKDMPIGYKECAYIIANVFPFDDDTKEYAYMCAEELVEKLNERI